MLKARMEYGAVYAKVMAMYGKMLKEDDWRRLCECKSVIEICAFLRNHKGWSGTVTTLSQSPSPKMLQTAVRKRLNQEYEKIYNFASIEDKKYLRLYLYRAEYDFILDSIREKCAYEKLPRSSTLTDFIRKHSSVDIEALEQSHNFTGVLNAIKGSVFESPLSELKVNTETGLPNYCEVGIQLENAYFKAVFLYITKKYKGMGKSKLTETLGTEADLLNIISILRLHRNFPASLERADELLVPISYHLKPDLFQLLRDAKNEDEAIEILRKSSFGKRFNGLDTSNIENIYNRSMEKLCGRLIKSVEPDIGVPQAYLILKELECNKLIRVIEAVSCGVDPKNAI